MIRSLRQEG